MSHHKASSVAFPTELRNRIIFGTLRYLAYFALHAAICFAGFAALVAFRCYPALLLIPVYWLVAMKRASKRFVSRVPSRAQYLAILKGNHHG